MRGSQADGAVTRRSAAGAEQGQRRENTGRLSRVQIPEGCFQPKERRWVRGSGPVRPGSQGQRSPAGQRGAKAGLADPREGAFGPPPPPRGSRGRRAGAAAGRGAGRPPRSKGTGRSVVNADRPGQEPGVGREAAHTAWTLNWENRGGGAGRTADCGH